LKIIAIDSSGLVASVAILEDETMIAEYTVNYKKTHSQTLLPMLDEIKKMTELDLATIDAIAIAEGPGSFTGLRIGAATAKGLALALRKPLIAVPTVDALAYNLYQTNGLICPMMDARRSQVYTGIYHFDAEGFHVDMKQTPMAVEKLAEHLNQLAKPVILLGDGMPVYREQLKKMLKIEYREAPLHVSRQRAGAVGALAMQYAAEGKFTDAEEFKPDYLRLSQAEREREERLRAEGVKTNANDR
jgi:tRNA threonylcarbamoyladenosine biosynthesis protein TsaB